MTGIQRRGHTLLGRIILFLVIFGITFLFQMGIGIYQSENIMKPTEERTDNIQIISQFLENVDTLMTSLADYRWDYGDTAQLTETIRTQLDGTSGQIEEIKWDLHTDSEEYCLLASSVHTTYGVLSDILNEISESVSSGRSTGASQVYYDRALPCGTYLMQYTRQLLEQAIHDNHAAFDALEKTDSMLERVRAVVNVLSVAAACVMVASLILLLRSVHQMSQASEQISQGKLDIPDVDVRSRDEIGDLARTFNEMKRSMKKQVELLNQNNQMERDLHAKETEALELQTLVEREKLQHLRSQINPHFLFNTLNVIMYYARVEGAQNTSALLGSMSRMLRYALGDNTSSTPLSREVQIVNEFYALYKARFEDRLTLTWSISPEVDLTETMVPSFLLQPLVENAFVHGVAHREENGLVDVKIWPEEDSLYILVRDNGVGMSEESLESLKEHLYSSSPEGKHIGLHNVATRLRLAGSRYGFEITSKENEGTAVQLRLPLVIEEGSETEDDDEAADHG